MFERLKRKQKSNTLWTERDWSTRILIHHVDHLQPDLLTVPGGYFQAQSSTEFAQLEKEARAQLSYLEISTDCAPLFDQAVRVRTLQLQNKLLSERLYHFRDAIQNRTDARTYLHQKEQRLADLETAYDVLEQERRTLLET